MIVIKSYIRLIKDVGETINDRYHFYYLYKVGLKICKTSINNRDTRTHSVYGSQRNRHFIPTTGPYLKSR